MHSASSRLRNLGVLMLQWSLAIQLFLSSVQARPAILRPYTESSHPEQTFHGNQFMGAPASLHTYSSWNLPSKDYLSASSTSASGGFSNWIDVCADQPHQSAPQLRQDYKLPQIDLPNCFKHESTGDENPTQARPTKRPRTRISDPEELPESNYCLQAPKASSQTGASSQEKQEEQAHVNHVAASPNMMMVDGSNSKTPGSRWETLYSNLNKVKLLGTSASSKKENSTPPGILWQKLYWNRHKIKLLSEEASSREETLIPLPDQILMFWWRMTKSFKQLKVSGDPISNKSSKGKMKLVQGPSEDQASTSAEANNLDAIPFTSANDSDGNLSKSLHNPSIAPHAISESPKSPDRMNAKKHWRSAANKVRAVKAFGRVDKAIHCADRILKNIDGIISVVNKALEHIDDVGEKAEELELFSGLRQNGFGNLELIPTL